MKRMGRTRFIPVITLAAACTSSTASDALGPTAPELATSRPSKGATMAADLILHGGLGFASSPLVSTCPGAAFSDYHVEFGASGCLTISPTGASYDLTDDVGMGAIGLKKDGTISRVRFWAHDVAGPDGIKHDTDDIPVAIPVVPDPAGFVVHVHADNVPVYRLSGHTGGKRVAMIGTISVWDVAYRVP